MCSRKLGRTREAVKIDERFNEGVPSPQYVQYPREPAGGAVGAAGLR
uniref:Uncharacterized protein n=1 Tax=Anguilla anguilla TaxID=7936 RepID=A0A0E9VPA5_ANGAN